MRIYSLKSHRQFLELEKVGMVLIVMVSDYDDWDVERGQEVTLTVNSFLSSQREWFFHQMLNSSVSKQSTPRKSNHSSID